MSMESAAPSDRLTQSPLRLLRQAAGSPADLARKLRDLLRAVGRWADANALDARLQRLHDLGYIATVPTRLQLVVGSVDMLRFWISPAAADYYASLGIDYTFHQVLRFLDDPTSLIDPVGFLSTRDTIIGHLLQVVHANPRYDLQLLDSHPGGLDALEAQIRQMLAGTHPRQRSIAAIVEDPGYHERLLSYVVAYRDDPTAPAPLRDNVAGDPRLAAIEATFGSLPTAMAYFATMPRTVPGAVAHLVRVREMPLPRRGA